MIFIYSKNSLILILNQFFGDLQIQQPCHSRKLWPLKAPNNNQMTSMSVDLTSRSAARDASSDSRTGRRCRRFKSGVSGTERGRRPPTKSLNVPVRVLRKMPGASSLILNFDHTVALQTTPAPTYQCHRKHTASKVLTAVQMW